MLQQPVASQSLDWAKFSNLPPELILQISQCKILTRNDVLSVALTCRQYHQLLLPLLFHLFGLPPAPIQYASLTLNRYHSCKGNPPSISQYREPHVVPGSPSPDTLTMLNMAFHLTSIPRLKCTIHGGHFEVIIHQVNRLRCALQRLSVDDVELVFGPIVQDAEGRRLTPDQDVRLWTDSLGGLLNTIVRKRAKRLAIRDGAIMTKAYYHAPIAFSTSQSIFNRFTSTPFIYRATQESKYLGFSGFIRDPSLSVIAPDFPANISSQITTLEISSEIMITPPFSHWTFSLIKASPNLTTLILSNFSLLPKIWELTLTLLSNCLNAAKCILTSFSLTWCSSPPKPSLIEFLHNLPNLTTLILDEKPTWTPNPPNIPTFQYLTKIQAHVRYLFYFFHLNPSRILRSMDINAILPPPVSPGDPPSNPNPLPNLREVWIQIPPTNWTFAEADWTSLLRFMAPKNYPIIALVFEDENQPGSLDFLQTPVDWFISQNHPVDATAISILLKPFECITDLVLPVRCFGFGQKRLPIHSSLDLSSDDEFVEEPSSMTDILRKTCAFVNCFSAVKKITVNAKRYQTRFAPARPPTEREIKVLVSQLKNHCPRIRELVVNEVMYSVQEIAI